MSRRKKSPKTKRAAQKVALYECKGCGRRWKEDLLTLQEMRETGKIPSTYSGTHCPCGHPYIEWVNWDAVAPLLTPRSGP